jgi:hypothetical protein
MKVIHITAWDDFVDHILELEGWAFRGEVSASWPLVTSLARKLHVYAPDPVLWPLRESRALRIFRRKAHNYLSDHTSLQDDFRCLAMMQHHGAPTRLLDFSKSPYVAAFFALAESQGDVAVYALNTPALWQATPTDERHLTREECDPRVQGHYERYYLPNRHKFLWFGEPAEMDRRLIAQSGLFVVPGRLDMSISDILQAYTSPTHLLVKFILPHSLRNVAMQALYRMNVTYATLFPDLEGLAKASAYELEVVWERLKEDYVNKTKA